MAAPGATQGNASQSSTRLPASVIAAAGFAVLLAYRSWPLITRPERALVDPLALGTAGAMWAKSDLDLLVWIVGWTAHAVIAQPFDIFQGNIFYPAPDALASSEHLLGLLPVSGPVFWLSGNAVLAYNLTTLAVIWVAALATFLLVFSWSGRASAGFLAGALFALGDHLPLSFVRLHVSAIHLYPLVLLLAWRVAQAPRRRTIIALWLVTALQALSGIYVAFGLAALVLGATPSLIGVARRNGHTGLAPLGTLALAAFPLALVSAPYLRIQDAGLLPDPVAAQVLVQQTSSSAVDLLGRLYAELTMAGLCLAALGVLFARRAPWASLCLISIGAVGFLLALGTRATLPGTGLPSAYEILMHTVPGFAGMRSPGRFLALTELSLAALAGLGAAQLVALCERRWRAGGRRAAAAAVVLLAVVLVPLRAPRWPLPLSSDPLANAFVGSHRWLAEHAEDGPVLDLPALTSVMEGRALLSTGRAMLGSTLHWMPLINGYSGHPPPGHNLIMTLAQRVPDPDALRDLCTLTGLRWIIAHHGLLPGTEETWNPERPELPLVEVAQVGRDTIYEVHCPSSPTGRALANDKAPLLDGGAGRAHLVLELPIFVSGRVVRLWADVTNLGDRTWPGLKPSGGVTLRVRWYHRDSGELAHEDPAVPLARDLTPGSRVRAQFETVPPAPGTYLLELEIGQDGGPPFKVTGSPLRQRVDVAPDPRPARS